MEKLNNHCNQCKDGFTKYGDKSFNEVYMEYCTNTTEFNIPEMLEKIIPFVIYQQHRKYCQSHLQ